MRCVMSAPRTMFSVLGSGQVWAVSVWLPARTAWCTLLAVDEILRAVSDAMSQTIHVHMPCLLCVATALCALFSEHRTRCAVSAATVATCMMHGA